MRLHVAAQAFPTYQGTQAIVRKMLEVENAAGVPSELVTYAARGYTDPLSFAVHRPPSLPLLHARALLRSGPAAIKPLLDVQLLAHLRGWIRRLRPDVLIAHHVEAAIIGLACKGPPVVFFAHTDLADELPSYGSQYLSSFYCALGEKIDRYLVRRAAATATISPWLRDRFAKHASNVHHVSPPFEAFPVVHDRKGSREELGLCVDDAVVLYAGNLDAYQGVDCLPEVLVHLASLDKRVTMLIATESDPRHLLRAARQANVAACMRIVGLSGEEQRARVHAAADVALVPRRSMGGLPIKLLDAMARDVAIVASAAACAGYPLRGACLIAQNADSKALARHIAELLSQPTAKNSLVDCGRHYLRETHSPANYLSSMQATIDDAVARTTRRSSSRMQM